MTETSAGPSASEPVVLTAQEVADLLRISTWKLYRDIRDERIPASLRPLPIGRPFRWSTVSVLRFLNQAGLDPDRP